MHSLFDIEGKKAIVTGGTRGLGYSMAEGLMEAGCEVAIVGTSDKVYEVADEFCKKGFRCHGVKADLGKREQVYRAFADCMEALGDLDILVNAHGIQRRCSSEAFPMQDWDDVINVNLNSVFILCQEAAKVMLKKGYGKIINIASMISFFGGQTIFSADSSSGRMARCPCDLQVKSTGHRVKIKHFTGKIQSGYLLRFHRTRINFFYTDTSTCHYCLIITAKTGKGQWELPCNFNQVFPLFL